LIGTASLLTPELTPSIRGWRVNPAAYAKSRLTLALDHELIHGGRASLHILPKSAVGSGEDQLTAIQNVKADRYRGKRVRLSGYVRAAENASGVLWLRVDDAEGHAFDIANNMSSEQAKANVVRGSGEWRRVEQVVDVPPEAYGLAFGVYCGGPGQVWGDDLALEIVDQAVPVTAFGQDATRRNMAERLNRPRKRRRA